MLRCPAPYVDSVHTGGRVDLQEAIQSELNWLLSEGYRPGRDLETRAQHTVMAVLQRYGIRGARVRVKSKPGGLDLSVDLPPAVPQVKRIQLSVG